MKTNRYSFPVMAATALTIVLAAPSLGFAADKKPLAEDTLPAKAAAKTAAAKETTAAKAAPAAAETKEAPVADKAAEAVPAAPSAPAAAPAPAPAKGFFGGLFGKKGAPAPAAAPVPGEAPKPAANAKAGPGGMPMVPPPPPPPSGLESSGRQAALPSISDELSAKEKGIDSKVLDAAKDAAKVLDTKEKIKSYLRMPATMVIMQFDQANPGKMDVIQKGVDEALGKLADSYADNAQKNKAIALARFYTADELNQLEKFFDSSTGKKTLKVWDQIAAADAEMGRMIEMRDRQKIQEALIKEMKRNDLKVPKSLE
ncbi:MAG: hypothetical protein WC464_01475 [Bdellovibrionales bacterium]